MADSFTPRLMAVMVPEVPILPAERPKLRALAEQLRENLPPRERSKRLKAVCLAFREHSEIERHDPKREDVLRKLREVGRRGGPCEPATPRDRRARA